MVDFSEASDDLERRTADELADAELTRDVATAAESAEEQPEEQTATAGPGMPEDFDPFGDIDALFDFVRGTGDPKAVLDIMGVREALWELKVDPRAFFRRIPSFVRAPAGLVVYWFLREGAARQQLDTSKGADDTSPRPGRFARATAKVNRGD